MSRFDEYERQSIARELWSDAWGSTHVHRLVFDLESDTEKAVKYLQAHGFTDVFSAYDYEAKNYDLSFKSDHKLSDAQIDEVCNNTFECSASSFNIGDF